MMAWTFMSAYFVVALLLSVAGAIGVFMIAFNRRIPLDVALFYLITFAGSITYVLTTRDLSQPIDPLNDVVETGWAGRVANPLCLGICLAAAISIGLRGVPGWKSVLIAGAALQYYFVCFLMPVSFDRWFVFDHRLFYPLMGLLVVMMPTGSSTDSLGRHFARAASIPAILSVILLLARPDAAVLSGYQSILPFFKGRLYGAQPHPNALGNVCAFALLLLATFRMSPRQKWPLVVINVIALVLCQSKTSWVSALLGVSVVSFSRARLFSGRIPEWVYLAAVAALAAVPAALSMADKSIYDYWAGNENIRELGTLTGRTDIWRATLYLVSQHPITGPGWATYQIYMTGLFPNLVPNPHNLYLATLVQAGIIGLVSLALFLFSLVFVAVRLKGLHRQFAVAFLLMFALQGMSEALTFHQAFLANSFWILLMYMRLVSVASARRVEPTAP